MQDVINKYLANQRIGCLSVALPDGTVHGATVHFSHADNPFLLYIQTGKGTKKAKAFEDGLAKASFVIGFSEDEWLTLQLDGEARLLGSEAEIEQFRTIHYAKHPQAAKYAGPTTLYIEFKPVWYRFTDFNTDPETLIEQAV